MEGAIGIGVRGEALVGGGTDELHGGIGERFAGGGGDGTFERTCGGGLGAHECGCGGEDEDSGQMS